MEIVFRMRLMVWLALLGTLALSGYAVAGGDAAGGRPTEYSGPVAEIPELQAGQTWTFALSNGDDWKVELREVSADKRTLVTTPFVNYPPGCDGCRDSI